MKEEKTDWLLRVIYFNKKGRRITDFETLYDMFYKDVLKMAKEISSGDCIVHIYELKDSISFGTKIQNPKSHVHQ